MQALIVDVIVALVLILFAVMAIGPFVLQMSMERTTQPPAGADIISLPHRAPGTTIERPAA